MELKEYYQAIKDHWKIFLLIWLGVLLLLPVLGWVYGQEYKSVFSVSVKRGVSERAEDYQYDQYYRLLAEEKFSEKVLAWFGDPETVKLVFEQAGVEGRPMSWQSLATVFETKKISVGYSQVHFQGFPPKKAEKIGEIWQKILAEKINQENQSKKSDQEFSFILGKSLTNLPVINYFQLALIGALIGWPLALFGVLFVDYFRKTDAHRN